MINWKLTLSNKVVEGDELHKWNSNLKIKEATLGLYEYKFTFKLPESNYKLQAQFVVSGDEKYHLGYRFVYRIPKELKGKFFKIFNLGKNFFIGEVKGKEKESHYVPRKSKEIIFIIKPNSPIGVQIK